MDDNAKLVVTCDDGGSHEFDNDKKDLSQQQQTTFMRKMRSEVKMQKRNKSTRTNNFLASRVVPRLEGQQCRCAKVFATPDDDGIHYILKQRVGNIRYLFCNS